MIEDEMGYMIKLKRTSMLLGILIAILLIVFIVL